MKRMSRAHLYAQCHLRLERMLKIIVLTLLLYIRYCHSEDSPTTNPITESDLPAIANLSTIVVVPGLWNKKPGYLLYKNISLDNMLRNVSGNWKEVIKFRSYCLLTIDKRTCQQVISKRWQPPRDGKILEKYLTDIDKYIYIYTGHDWLL